MTDSAGETMKIRLRNDLKAAMKERRGDEVKVLRALISALDNAEAPAVDAKPQAVEDMGGLGSTEMQRLTLDADGVRTILRAQQAEREAAAAELDRVGRTDLADASRAEVAVVQRYLQ